MKHTLEQQIRCVDREIAFRRRVYPKVVAKGNMTQSAANEEIELMESVLATLRELKQPQLGL